MPNASSSKYFSHWMKANRQTSQLVSEHTKSLTKIKVELVYASSEPYAVHVYGKAGASVVMRALRVLLVDDDPLDRLMAEEAFALLEQPCMLETAHSGLAALTQLQQPGAVLPDVVLLDLNMPGLNGFEVLATLKRVPHLRALPVVILTTSANPGDMTQAQTLEASGYLIKSIHFQTFFQQIEKFIDVWFQSQRAMSGMNVGESRAV